MRIVALLLFSAWVSAATPKVVFIAGEFEYKSKETLPLFAKELSKSFEIESIVLQRPDDEKVQSIPGLEALKDADLLVLFVRRMTLPQEQLALIRAYVESGKPLLGVRTTSHAFENWKTFDPEVLGGSYKGHHGNRLKTGVTLNPGADDHPILKGVTGFVSEGSLYKNTPLQPDAHPLLIGRVEGFPSEPVAWTREVKGARVFYTSLGHPEDFKEESFRTLLSNAMGWLLDKPLEPRR